MTNPNQSEDITFVNAPLDKRIQLVEASFNAVLNSDLHEDDKAGRILSAIAFLTAAAAGIFSAAYSPNLGGATLNRTLQQSPLTIFGLNASVLAFSAYIFFILIGAVLYLGALGPSFNRPSWFGNRSQQVHSLLFFRNIGALDAATWSNYWLKDGNTLAELQSKLVENYIYECWLIAQKEEAKVTLMSLGSLSFRIAILFLVMLTATLFLPNPGMVWVLLLLGLFGISASFLFVNLVLHSGILQLILSKRHQKVTQTAIQQNNASQITQPAVQQSNEEKVPWQTCFLIVLTGLSFIGFVILLILELTGHIA